MSDESAAPLALTPAASANAIEFLVSLLTPEQRSAWDEFNDPILAPIESVREFRSATLAIILSLSQVTINGKPIAQVASKNKKKEFRAQASKDINSALRVAAAALKDKLKKLVKSLGVKNSQIVTQVRAAIEFFKPLDDESSASSSSSSGSSSSATSSDIDIFSSRKEEWARHVYALWLFLHGATCVSTGLHECSKFDYETSQYKILPTLALGVNTSITVETTDDEPKNYFDINFPALSPASVNSTVVSADVNPIDFFRELTRSRPVCTHCRAQQAGKSSTWTLFKKQKDIEAAAEEAELLEVLKKKAKKQSKKDKKKNKKSRRTDEEEEEEEEEEEDDRRKKSKSKKSKKSKRTSKDEEEDEEEDEEADDEDEEEDEEEEEEDENDDDGDDEEDDDEDNEDDEDEEEEEEEEPVKSKGRKGRK